MVKDKRVVMISMYHGVSMEKVVIIEKGGQQKEIEKSVCVLDCTKYMDSDHYCAPYSFIFESLKQWRKLFQVPGSVHSEFLHFILLSEAIVGCNTSCTHKISMGFH
jgi:hypothetical protein